MRQYEVTFIVDPVLSNDEIQSTSQNYIEQLKGEGCEIVHLDEMGLRQLAYPIKKRNSGVYYCIEFKGEDLDMIGKLELALRRDERIIRFLTVTLDKYGVKYNDDKRNGLIGKKKEKAKAEVMADVKKEARTEPKAEVEKEVKAEPKAEVEKEVKAEPEAEVKAEPEAEVKAEPEAEVKAEEKKETEADKIAVAASIAASDEEE